MRVITVQSREVLLQLNKNGKFTVSNNAPVSSNLVKPYKFMMKHYGYSNRPIFMCPVGHRVEFGGAKFNEAFIIEMDIPDRFCKIQDYYGWSDFIYFTELPMEYEQFKGCKTVEQFGKYVLDMYKNGFGDNKNTVYQVTTQFIRMSWIKKVVAVDRNFIDTYSDIGGKNVLKSIY